MRGLKSRIEQLESIAGAGSQKGIQVFLMHAGEEFALDLDRCADILVEAGFLQRGRKASVLNFYMSRTAWRRMSWRPISGSTATKSVIRVNGWPVMIRQ